MANWGGYVYNQQLLTFSESTVPTQCPDTNSSTKTSVSKFVATEDPLDAQAILQKLYRAIVGKLPLRGRSMGGELPVTGWLQVDMM